MLAAKSSKCMMAQPINLILARAYGQSDPILASGLEFRADCAGAVIRSLAAPSRINLLMSFSDIFGAATLIEDLFPSQKPRTSSRNRWKPRSKAAKYLPE